MLLGNGQEETRRRGSGRFGSWSPAKAVWLHQPEPNLGLDTFELCRGMVLKSSCEIWGLEKGSHTFPGVPG